MRYLRMLSNALVAGGLATAYVLLVVWQLNPGLRLDPVDLVPLARVIGPFYVVHLTAGFYVLLVGRQLLTRELFSPGWVSVGVLSWLCGFAAACGAALTWANLTSFTLVLRSEIVSAMTTTATTLALSAAAFLLVAIWHRRDRRHLRWIRAAAVVTIAVGSVAGPMAVRGEGREQQPPVPPGIVEDTRTLPEADRGARITVVALDAGSMEIVAGAAADGRLPNFGRLLDSGAVMDLSTLRPTSAEGVWTAVATGKLPQKNGIRGPALYRLNTGGQALSLLPDYAYASGLVRFGFLREEPHTSTSVIAKPLWTLLDAHGVTVGVVNWPLTYPAPSVHGFAVSDRHVRLALTPFGLDDPRLVHPAVLRDRSLRAIEDMRYLPDVAPPMMGAVLEERHRTASKIDRIHGILAETLGGDTPPQVTIVRYESLDLIGHDFLRYTMPSRFGNVTEGERRRYGPVLESHYGIVDEAIGRAMDRLGRDDLLFVVSGYGMEPLSTGKRLVEQLIGDPEVSGTHENAPDGFLMAYGSMIEPNRHLTRASVVDLVPTVLYFLGLPVARDMDGFARTALFRSSFTDERPITYIPSYEP